MPSAVRRKSPHRLVAAEADYVLALEQNQGCLYEDVTFLFEDLCESKFTAFAYDSVREVDKGHGRIEIRQCWTLSDPTLLPHLRGRPRLTRAEKACLDTLATTSETKNAALWTRYFTSTLPGDAEQRLQAVRAQADRRMSCHWVLDFAFREDETRLRQRGS